MPTATAYHPDLSSLPLAHAHGTTKNNVENSKQTTNTITILNTLMPHERRL